VDADRAPAAGVSLELATVESTMALGRALGAVLQPGDLVLLTGSLGAGKTQLTKGIAAGMGVTGMVMSPTFVIARMHRPGEHGVPLVHVDAYRLSGALELDDLDLDTDLSRAAVVVEWGEGVAEQLAQCRLIVALERRADDTRIARLTPVGDSWSERLPAVLEAFRVAVAAAAAASPNLVRKPPGRLTESGRS